MRRTSGALLPPKEAFSPIDRRVSAPSTPAFSPGASFESPKMPTPSAKQALLARLNDVSIPSSPWGAATTRHTRPRYSPTRHFESTAASPGWGRTGGGFGKVGTEIPSAEKDGTLRLKETMSPNATVKVYSPVRREPDSDTDARCGGDGKEAGRDSEEETGQGGDEATDDARGTRGRDRMPDGPRLEPEGSFVPGYDPPAPRPSSGSAGPYAKPRRPLASSTVGPRPRHPPSRRCEPRGWPPACTGWHRGVVPEWSTRVPGKPTPPKPRNPPVPKAKDLMRRRKPKKVLKKVAKNGGCAVEARAGVGA